MKIVHLFMIIVLVSFISCGDSSSKSSKDLISNSLSEDNNITQIDKVADRDKEKKNSYERVVVLYIHGYDKSGYKRAGVYGDDIENMEIEKIAKFGSFYTTKNYPKDRDSIIVATTEYYGDKEPFYYAPSDLSEVNSMQKGIPRYALIVAKYAKYILNETNATKLYIVSASMGSLITRYLIEKNLENLSKDKKIKKWLSLEGVVAGNIAASKDRLLNIVNSIEKQPYEVKQMRYSWVKQEFGDPYKSDSPFMKDIEISFESSTDDHLNNRAITLLTNKPNDGVQAVKDTYFSKTPNRYAHTYFYQTHTSLQNSKAAWAYATTFLLPNRRVQIKLKNVTVYDLHEKKMAIKNYLPADIVFESRVYAPKAMQKWNFDEAIDERVLNSHALKVFDFSKIDEKKSLDESIFDSHILLSEESLIVKITPYELDYEPEYNLFEITGHRRFESLGEGSLTFPLKNGIYNIRGEDWDAELELTIM